MKSKPLILNLETSTTVCSVSVTEGRSLLAHKETDEGYTHAENLHLFIEQVLKEAALKPAQLQAVAVSAGPGSYTGLRIGSSSAKGLCFALGIPLITLDTLQVLAYAIAERHEATAHLCPMLDAGRMEVYTAVFDPGLRLVLPVQALVLDAEAASLLATWGEVVFAGPGTEKAKSLLSAIPGATFVSGLKPSALHMTDLSFAAFNSRDFAGISDFEPFYLKNFIAGKKKKGVL